MRSLLVILLFVHVTINAQTTDQKIVFESSKKEISVADGELTDITIRVVNKTDRLLAGTVNIAAPKDLDLVSRNNIIISVKPGDSIYIPVKFYATQKLLAGKIHLINLRLLNPEKALIGSDVCNLHVAVKQNMALYSMVSNILLDRSVDSIRIPIRISNMGNTAQKITLINRYPSSVENNNFHASLQFVIPAGRDTLITFVKPVNVRMYSQDAFDVGITGLYANGELFGSSYIKIQSARNHRSFIDHTRDENYDNNSISLSTQGLFRETQAYILQGRGTMELPKSKLAYSLDYTAYKNTAYSPAMMRNTFLGFETHNMGIRAGNINRNLDINLSGRGGMFYVKDTAQGNRYEGGYINVNSNLFGRAFLALFPTGEAAWGAFTHENKKWTLTSTAIYELNPLTESRNMILTNEFTWTGTKDLRISASLNQGTTSEYDNVGGGKYVNTGKNKLSFASGLDISGTVKGLIFNSSNYFSSGYYPGMRRGALNLSERLIIPRSSGQLWASMDYYNYSPKFFSDAFLFESSFSNLRTEIGWSDKIFKSVTLSVAPYYAMETNNSFRFLNENNLHLRSWNVLSTINIPISETKYISINTEGGMFTSSLNKKPQYRFRTNSNYRHGIFNIMASAQVGTYYLGEVVNSFMKLSDNSHIINISPTVQKSFLRNKLRAEVGANYSNTKVSGTNWQLVGRTEYDVLFKTTLFAGINHNRYNFFGGLYTSSVLEVGIRKNMRSAKLGTNTNPLEVFVFKDINKNGIYDVGDSIATNHLVYINDEVFMTKGDGLIQYKKLPPGEYRITLPRIKGWYAPDQKINFEKKQRIEIPLQKAGTLKGKVTYEYNEFSYEIDQQKEGLPITARGENGQSYLTRTNTDGSYILFIPTGKYTVHVNTENLPPEIESLTGDQYTEVNSGEIQSVNLVLNIKQRKIETKKFMSTKDREREKEREREREREREKEK